MASYIVAGIDGGGTRTRACIMDSSTTVLGNGVGGPSSIDTVEPAASRAAIHEALAGAIAAAGGGHGRLRAIFAGIGGIISDADEAKVADSIFSLGLCEERSAVAAVNDVRVAFAGGLGGKAGIALIVGTGSVAFGRNEAGEEARAGGWGYKEGDPGSAFDIGMKAFKAMLRAYDGREPQNAISRSLFSALRIAKIEDAFPLLYGGGLGRTEIAAFAPLVAEAAASGDRKAQAILEEAASEAALMAEAVRSRIFPGASSVPLALVGGLVEREGYYRDLVERAISRRSILLKPSGPSLSPVEGAALEALTLARRLGGAA